MTGLVPIRTHQEDSDPMNCFMRFIPLRHQSCQLMLIVLSLYIYIVHAHYSELDAIYALIPSQASAFITL